MKMIQIILLDKHPINDGRIERHIKKLLLSNYKVIRIHFNRSEHFLSQGMFTQFGEIGYRVNIADSYKLIKNNPIYYNFFCFTPLISFKVKKIIKTLEIDMSLPTIIHVHDPALLPLAVWFKLTFNHAKIVYDRHEVYEIDDNYWGVKLPQIERVYEIQTKDYIDGVISVSKEHNIPINALFPKSIISTIPNYPSRTEYNSEAISNKIRNFKKETAINLVYVGSLANNYDRDVDLLLTICEKILRINSTINFNIAGICDDPILCEKFKKLTNEFSGRFNYLGKISREQTVHLTEQSHIGFFLIRPDTNYWVHCSPNKVFEYLICGTIPVIRADVSNSQDISCCSLIFQRGTPEQQIVSDVLDLVSDPIKIKKMMERALITSDNFTFELVGENYVKMYQSLLKNTKDNS